MSEHRYPWRVLRGDYIRALIGTAMCAGGALLTAGNVYVSGAFAAAGLLFIAFGLRTAWRQRTAYLLAADGLTRRPDGPLGRRSTVRWDDLRKVSMRFYSTRRDRSQGWMQLTVSGGGRRISLDSTIYDFDAIARAAARAALQNRIDLRSSTLANLEAIGINTARLGIDPPAGDPPR